MEKTRAKTTESRNNALAATEELPHALSSCYQHICYHPLRREMRRAEHGAHEEVVHGRRMHA